MGKVRALTGLIKPELPIAAGTCVVVGQVLALQSVPDVRSAALGFLIGLLISGSEMVSNDLFDLEVDRVNHPQRPLPSGQVTVGEVTALAVLLAVLGMLFAFLAGPLVLAFTLVILISGTLYNWKLKDLGLPGNAIVALSVGMTFVLGGMVVDRPDNGLVWTFALMAALFDLAEEVSGGIRDAVGDALRGSRSLALKYGRRTAMVFVTMLFAAFMIIGTVPYIVGWLGLPYLLLMIVADVITAFLVTRLWRAATPEEGRSVQRALYLMMTAFIVAIAIVVLL